MKKKLYVIIVCIVGIGLFIAGMGVGSILFPQTNVKVMQQDCHDYYARYMQFTEITRENIFPINETDNVTISVRDEHIYIRHDTPNEYGMKHIHIGISDDGFYDYIEMQRTPYIE